MPWGRQSATLCTDTERRPGWDRVTCGAHPEVGPMIDIVIATTMLAVMALVVVVLERSERVQ